MQNENQRVMTPGEVNTIRALTLDEARGRKLNAEAEMAELELAKIRAELVKTEDVVKAWEDVLRAMKAKMLSIPTKMASAMSNESDPNVCKTILDKEIEEALHELANYQPRINATQSIGSSEQIEDSDDNIEATAQVERKRVGRPRKKIGQPEQQ